MTDQGNDGITSWIRQRRDACGLLCEPIDWNQTEEWIFRHGEIRHRTGGFFSIRGVTCHSNDARWNGIEQPIIDQPEIGILGCLFRKTRRGLDVLLQAKTEPGNVESVQIGPSVQATVSNYTRLHGGAPTPYLEYFLAANGKSQCVADSKQSEQGNRFLNKFNRNMSLVVSGNGPEPVSDSWSWQPVGNLLPLLTTDWCVNTDARSVLCSSDWGLLSENGRPFSSRRSRSGFGVLLRRSFEAPDEGAEHSYSKIIAWINSLNCRISIARNFVPLNQLSGWSLTDDGVVDERFKRFWVRLFDIRANDREVSTWQQPLLAGIQPTSIVLLCQERRGLLHFLVRAGPEIGFTEGVQLGPTGQSDQTGLNGDALADLALDRSTGQEILSVLQSDEGGRFYRSVASYSIKLLDDAAAAPAADDARWATLGQLYRLSKCRGRLTNELRSALSLLLSYL